MNRHPFQSSRSLWVIRLRQASVLFALAMSMTWPAGGSIQQIGELVGSFEVQESQGFSAEDLEFFESRIRPVITEHCYRCHSHQVESPKAGLRLDSRESILEAKVVVSGKPAQSKLIDALYWKNPALQMPPRGKLEDSVIARFEEWIQRGLPWPDEAKPTKVPSAAQFDLEERRQNHWAWTPPVRHHAPAVQSEWGRNWIDDYILVKLEKTGIHPSAEANKRTLIRRLSLDLIGLPPSEEDVCAFLNDERESAYEDLVDRLLRSPRFGENWARHWLDLMRFGESYGHEYDWSISNSWRYRDYLIRAFNRDVPYDQFVREQVAGDLLDSPRRDPETQLNESILGTGFYWLGEQTHSPVDAKAHESDRVANQIDVLTKSFQGVTVACARCHDHKFDAISTADYYALYGILSSTRYVPQELNCREDLRALETPLRALTSSLDSSLKTEWRPREETIARHWLAATQILDRASEVEKEQRAKRLEELTEASSKDDSFDRDTLTHWVGSVEVARNNPLHPLHNWQALLDGDESTLKDRWSSTISSARDFKEDAGDESSLDIEDLFRRGTRVYGQAFEEAEVAPGTLLPADGWDRAVGSLAQESGYSSARIADLWQGSLQTQTFDVERAYLHVLAQGRDARINVVVDGFKLIRDPIYARLQHFVHTETPRWYSFPMDKWVGGVNAAYVEILDLAPTDPGFGGSGTSQGDTQSPPNANATVYRVVASDHKNPPRFAGHSTVVRPQLKDLPPRNRRELAAIFEAWVSESAHAWQEEILFDDPESTSRLSLLSAMMRGSLFAYPGAKSLDAKLTEFRTLADQVARPVHGLTAAEGTGRNSPVFIRGGHRTPGESVNRGFLTAIDGARSPISEGSGRLSLAERITDPQNPLTSRVLVNRLWHHLFGAGLVRTVDNFGEMGEEPSHHELLDSLAIEFVEDDQWSIKKMIRRMVLSATYRQSSTRSSEEAERLDPQNRLRHRQNLKRMTAEQLRDSILFVSQELDMKMYGAGIRPYLTSFMEGRGLPDTGPLDGNGRRSIYMNIRRNFLPPMMLAFDMPIPFTSMGRRNVSNVPAQALILLNDPFVHDQAAKWASRVSAMDRRPEDVFYMSLFARLPSALESQAALQFLVDQAQAYGESLDNGSLALKCLADYAHALLNLKEFLFIP